MLFRNATCDWFGTCPENIRVWDRDDECQTFHDFHEMLVDVIEAGAAVSRVLRILGRGSSVLAYNDQLHPLTYQGPIRPGRYVRLLNSNALALMLVPTPDFSGVTYYPTVSVVSTGWELTQCRIHEFTPASAPIVRSRRRRIITYRKAVAR